MHLKYLYFKYYPALFAAVAAAANYVDDGNELVTNQIFNMHILNNEQSVSS